MATFNTVVTVNDHRSVAPATQRQVPAERSLGVLVGGRQDRGQSAAVLAAILFVLGGLPAGCVFNDDGPKTGPGLEPPVTVGNPGSGDFGTGSPSAVAGTGGGVMNPDGAPAPGPMMPAAGTGSSGSAGMTGAPQTPPGTSSGGAAGGAAGVPASAAGTGGGGGAATEPDGGASACETERWPALGLDRRIIAPPGDAAVSNLGPCEYALPESAAEYLPDRVNLEVTREGQRETIPRVSNAAACGLTGGFYYDDALDPTRIVACPTTCIAITQSDAVEIVLGCPTVTE